MNSFLTDEQRRRHAEYQNFAAEHVAPFASEWDRAQKLAPEGIAALSRAGYLGTLIPSAYGGQGQDAVCFGLLNEALGRHDSAFTGVVTVQAMVTLALLKWGTEGQRARWLPPLARGEMLAAFAMTEPAGGSDVQALATEFRSGPRENELVLNGEKKWISCGQMADVFLVFGKLEQKPVACLVPRKSAGLEIEPITDLLGFRAAGLARLRFRDVVVPASNLVGKPGFAFSHVAPVGLHFGRISTACSALGLLRGCVEESAAWAADRTVGGLRLRDTGMIQSLMAKMGTDLEAARLLCLSMCRAEAERQPDAFNKAFIAKYFTSRAVVQAAADAIQIHGAAGVHESSPVARFYRACKIMEIIEGTTQVHEAVLGRAFINEAARQQKAAPVTGAALVN